MIRNTKLWLFAAILLGVALAIGFASCEPEMEKENIAVERVELPTEFRILVGGTCQLPATISPSDATDPSLTWVSSSPAVATVDDKGFVTALSLGQTTVTATATSGRKATCIISVVSKIDVTGVKLSDNEVTLTLGVDTVEVNATVLPNYVDETGVTWTNTDEAVVEMIVNGNKVVLVGKTKGSAKIIVTSVEGGFTDTCTVKVAVPVESVSLDKKSIELTVGGAKEILSATVLPANANEKEVSFESSDSNIATVNDKGEVVGRVVGKAKIIVTTKSKNVKGKALTDTCDVVVKPTSVAITLAVGSAITLSEPIAPADDLKWKSANPAVAKVDSVAGTITGVAVGTTDITVYHSDTIVIATISVIVMEGSTAPTTYAISMATFTNGNVTADKAEAAAGETVTLTVAPEAGFQLKDGTLKVNNGAVTVTGSGNTYTFQMPAEAVTVEAEFEQIPPATHAITVDPNITNGTVSVNPTEAAAGAPVTVTVAPAAGYQLKAGTLKFNGTEITENGGVYSFVMPDAEVTVTAEFEAVP